VITFGSVARVSVLQNKLFYFHSRRIPTSLKSVAGPLPAFIARGKLPPFWLLFDGPLRDSADCDFVDANQSFAIRANQDIGGKAEGGVARRRTLLDASPMSPE
jgi:hypothetical protein